MSNLRQNNPYITGYIINYPEGDQSLERFKIKYNPSVKDKLHTVTDFDTLWSLSYDNYGDSKWWWVIADVNNIDHPCILQVNTNIIIPDLDKIRDTVL